MTRYAEDARGRLFRRDADTGDWYRLLSHDEEYDTAAREVCDTAATPSPHSPCVPAPRTTGSTSRLPVG